MHSTTEIRTRDGRNIGMCCYLPEADNGRLMIIAPTGQATQEFYLPIARFFRQQGFVVITFDYRGMGNSAPAQLKGYDASMHQWAVQDIDAVILFAKSHYPNREIVYLGHCIGGEIVGLAQASQYIGRLVLVSSSLSCKKYWPFRERFRIAASRIMVKLLSLIYGYFPGTRLGMMRDMPKGVMYEWASWCNHSNGLFDKFPDNNYRKLQVPLMAFSFSDDRRCPPRAVEELLNRFSNTTITWNHLDPADVGMDKVGNRGFFQPIMQTTLWTTLLQWLNRDERKDAARTVTNQ